MGRSGSVVGLAVALSVLGVAPAVGDEISQIVGLDDLIARLGEDAPTGLGVVVGQIEAGDVGSYGPDQAHTQFVGKLFHEMSGAAGTSGHATTVAKHQYGLVTSIAPAVDEIFLYSANGWIDSDYLRTGTQGVPPVDTPADLKLLNSSWIGSMGGQTNDALRRADFAVNRDQLVFSNGVNNGGVSQPLLSHMYNGIAVGIRSGAHTYTNTLTGFDGPGRMKPEMVAPGDATSWATPVINAGGSLLVETARTWDGLASNPNALRADVLKASLLAGATHEDLHDGEWSNQPSETGPNRGWTKKPIDNVVGAGTLNIDHSHMILTGGEQDGSATPPESVNASWAGWDLASVGIGESAYWRVEVPETADEVSILVTWNRLVEVPFGADDWEFGGFDLLLWRVDDQGELATLLGDGGIPHFASGNVVSQSGIDNIEHLFIKGLEPGEYVIEVDRSDSLSGFATWDAAVAWLLPETTTTPEDINGDGVVDVLDLLAVLSAWGDCPGCEEDVNGDGVVDVLDLLAVLGAWG